jgi:predicted pyridoxine 5'-phosphate oxidase superfamily flavin-nucleotide-binding protein
VNELAARIADGWAPPLSDAERAAMETDRDLGLHLSSRREACDCKLCLELLPGLTNRVRKYIAAATPHIVAARDKELAEAGRLLPEGTAVPEEEIKDG